MSRNVPNLVMSLLVAIVFGIAGCGGGGTSATAPTVINTSPVANAGTPQQSVATGTVVTLDGSASIDANGDSLTYSWTITSKPTGSSAALSNVTAVKPTFTPDIAGVYVFKLIVNDGKVNSIAATVTATAVAPPHFVNKDNGTIYDSANNLIWLKDANCFGYQNWNTSTAKTNTLASGQCGLSDSSKAGDWHLPTIEELQILGSLKYASGQLTTAGFSNVQSSDYWSGNTDSSDNAWVVRINGGDAGTFVAFTFNTSKSNVNYVWPVRSGQ